MLHAWLFRQPNFNKNAADKQVLSKGKNLHCAFLVLHTSFSKECKFWNTDLNFLVFYWFRSNGNVERNNKNIFNCWCLSFAFYANLLSSSVLICIYSSCFVSAAPGSPAVQKEVLLSGLEREIICVSLKRDPKNGFGK